MPTTRPSRSRRLALPLAIALATALEGCDERTPLPPRTVEGGMDLSGLPDGPQGWSLRQLDRGRVPPIDTVRIGDSLWLLVSSRSGEAARWRRKVRWAADDYPVLSWKWAPQRKVDSAHYARRSAPASILAVDVTLASAFGLHKTLRYVWSPRRDKGREYQGDGWHPKVVVLRDATDSIAPREEQVDVWADFRRLWGFTPRHQALSIAVGVLDPDPSLSLTGRFGPIVARPGKETNR